MEVLSSPSIGDSQLFQHRDKRRRIDIGSDNDETDDEIFSMNHNQNYYYNNNNSNHHNNNSIRIFSIEQDADSQIYEIDSIINQSNNNPMPILQLDIDEKDVNDNEMNDLSAQENNDMNNDMNINTVAPLQLIVDLTEDPEEEVVAAVNRINIHNHDQDEDDEDDDIQILPHNNHNNNHNHHNHNHNHNNNNNIALDLTISVSPPPPPPLPPFPVPPPLYNDLEIHNDDKSDDVAVIVTKISKPLSLEEERLRRRRRLKKVEQWINEDEFLSKEIRKLSLPCPICHDTMTDPTSTLCGHIFCNQCLFDSLSRVSKCPMCQIQTNILHTHKVYL